MFYIKTNTYKYLCVDFAFRLVIFNSKQILEAKMKRLFFYILSIILLLSFTAHAELTPLTTNEMRNTTGQVGTMGFMPEIAGVLPGIVQSSYISAVTPLPHRDGDQEQESDTSLPGSAMERLSGIGLPTLDDFFSADISVHGAIVKSGIATFDGTTLKLENYTISTPEIRFDNIRPKGMETGPTYGSVHFSPMKVTMSGIIRIQTIP